ncbi:hypothetical protein SDC9_120448 [bioreactor metagenome]|uniref:Uncharacterized protein n=1 Tax=bioreactor metagenome TaxID=1076179 RepID=A0A645C7S9_9ZZZZ
MARKLGKHRIKHLRLDAQNNNIRKISSLSIAGGDTHAQPRRLLQLSGSGIGKNDTLRRQKSVAQHAAQNGAGHVSRANKSKSIINQNYPLPAVFR